MILRVIYMGNNAFSNKRKRNTQKSMQRSYVSLESNTTKIKSFKGNESSQQRFKFYGRGYSEAKVENRNVDKPKVGMLLCKFPITVLL